MLGDWLERLERVATSWIGLGVVFLVVVCQLLAVGAVASEQVVRSQLRAEALQKERQQQQLQLPAPQHRQAALRCAAARAPVANPDCAPLRLVQVAYR